MSQLDQDIYVPRGRRRRGREEKEKEGEGEDGEGGKGVGGMRRREREHGVVLIRIQKRLGISSTTFRSKLLYMIKDRIHNKYKIQQSTLQFHSGSF